MQKFGIKWYEYKECIIIPHRDEDGNLIAQYKDPDTKEILEEAGLELEINE